MICPILSQSSRDNDGNVAWDHHECIETSCTFWADEIHDCGIRASGLLIITRAKAALAGQQPGQDSQVPAGEPLFGAPQGSIDAEKMSAMVSTVEKANTAMRETGLKLLEGVAALEEPLRATGHELGGRLESLNATVLSMTTTVEGRVSRLEQGIGQVRQAMADASTQRPEYLKELEESLSSLARRLGGVVDRFTSLSGSLETVSTQVAALRDTHEELSASLAEEAERRKLEEGRRGRDEAMALNSRGVALYHRGASQAAEAAFRAALDLDAGFSEAQNNLGLALSKQGRDAEAEACFQRALELDPGMAEAMNNLGFLFHQGMQFEKAVEMFRRSTLTGQDSSLAYTNLGNACYKLGRYSEAVDAWKKAVEQNPLNENATKALRMFQQEQAGRV
ncbi:MAG TPA: tetratricopeptide repeat protein [Patescibacteria group bacterium]|nr:tetratricopeptide repeat protein [Patescibacteria group bacterium]